MTWPIGPVSWKSVALGNHLLDERIDFLKDLGTSRVVVWRVSRVRVRASVWHGTNTRFATVKVLQRRKTPARTTKGEGYLFHLRLLGQTDEDRRKNRGWFSQIPKGDATRQSRSPRSADEWTRDPTSKSCEKFGTITNSWPLLGISYTALRIRGIKTLNQSCARTRLALGNGDLSPGWMNEHPLPRWGIISWAPHQACLVTIEKPKYTK